MKLYLVRHGQTDWNIKRQSQGVADIELNSTGIAQAEELAKEIRRRGLEFDFVYSSPLRRAKKTAEIITDGRTDIIYDDRLVERDYGELEGEIVDWDNLGADDLSIRQNTGIYGMEPIKNVLARSKSFLDNLKAKHGPDDTILVVAHGTLLKAMHYNLVGYDENTDLRGFYMGNCELAELSLPLVNAQPLRLSRQN